jgi:transposase
MSKKRSFFSFGSEEDQNQEVENMENETNEVEVADEMVESLDEMAATELDTEVPADATPAVAAEEFKLADGTACSKSAFIREQFTKFNKSRKEISENNNIPYRTVYGATVNMENEAEPTSRGRGVTFSKINVTEDNSVVFVKDGIVYINGEAQPEGTEAPVTTEQDRNEWIKGQVLAGVNRGDIAKKLDLSYGVVYGITKEAEGTRQKYEVTLDDGTVISRSEHIRRQVEAGVSKADIAKELGVEYSVVWQATKKMKTVEEKFVDAVKGLEKFLDTVKTPDILTDLIAQLSGLEIKTEDANKVTDGGDVEATS